MSDMPTSAPRGQRVPTSSRRKTREQPCGSATGDVDIEVDIAALEHACRNIAARKLSLAGSETTTCSGRTKMSTAAA